MNGSKYVLILYNSDDFWEMDGRTLLLKSTGRTKNLFAADFGETPDSTVSSGFLPRQIVAFFTDQSYVLKYTNGTFHIYKPWPFPWSVLQGSSQRKIDAALFHFPTRTFFLFHGEKLYSCRIYKCSNYSSIEVNYNISGRWPGISNDISAAIYLPLSRKYYFFKRDMYWSFDEASAKVDKGYPRNVSQLFGK